MITIPAERIGMSSTVEFIAEIFKSCKNLEHVQTCREWLLGPLNKSLHPGDQIYLGDLLNKIQDYDIIPDMNIEPGEYTTKAGETAVVLVETDLNCWLGYVVAANGSKVGMYWNKKGKVTQGVFTIFNHYDLDKLDRPLRVVYGEGTD